MTTATIERKVFPLADAAIDDSGTISGYAAVFGNRDDGGDIIEPTFFDEVLGEFLKEGFVAWGHDWNTPCAMPTKATTDATGLWSAAKFHSDTQSQRYRVIAQERLTQGLSMGLSIGYEIAPGGATLEKDGRHLRKASRLFEWSLVLVPMNREAGATDVKTAQKAAAGNVADATYILQTVLRLIEAEAADLEPGDPDAAEDEQDVSTLGQIRDLVTAYIAATAKEVGTPEDLAEAAAEAAVWDWGYMGRTLAEHGDGVVKDVTAFRKRIKHLSRLRKEGRVLSGTNRTRLEGLSETLAAVMDDIKDLLASTETEKGLDPALMYELTMARSMGVAI
ncbi:MAG: HK97 family phage prohead protease [Frankiaceae bacterium]|nr:HK97 family phage prohead protease [Frankiaceae bacterium]